MAIITYEKAKELFATSRFKDAGKPLCNNTRLVKIDEHTYGIKLHNTVIVHIHANSTYSLFMDGWNTVTTRDRLMAFSPVYLRNELNVPLVFTESWIVQSEFYDGIKIDSAGTVISERRDPSVKLKEARAERNKRRYQQRKELRIVYQYGAYRIREIPQDYFDKPQGFVVEYRAYSKYRREGCFASLEEAKVKLLAMRIIGS